MPVKKNQTPSIEQLLFDTNETAFLLGRSAWSVRDLVYQQKLRPIRHTKRKLWFHIDEIRRFTSEQGA
jgi:hypothetical protein